jgi:hypothetical protein
MLIDVSAWTARRFYAEGGVVLRWRKAANSPRGFWGHVSPEKSENDKPGKCIAAISIRTIILFKVAMHVYNALVIN